MKTSLGKVCEGEGVLQRRREPISCKLIVKFKEIKFGYFLNGPRITQTFLPIQIFKTIP